MKDYKIIIYFILGFYLISNVLANGGTIYHLGDLKEAKTINLNVGDGADFKFKGEHLVILKEINDKGFIKVSVFKNKGAGTSIPIGQGGFLAIDLNEDKKKDLKISFQDVNYKTQSLSTTFSFFSEESNEITGSTISRVINNMKLEGLMILILIIIGGLILFFILKK